MKKILLIIFAATITTVSTSAQSKFKGWTVKAGMNLSTVIEQPAADFLSYSYKPGFTAGFALGWGFTDVIGLSVDVLYSTQGATMTGIEANGKLTESSSYINIPIMANAFIVKGLTAKAGVQLSYFLSANDEFTSSRENMTYDLISEYRTFDLSIPVGVEYAFDFGLAVEVRYNFGLTNIIKTAPEFPDMKSFNSYASITLGYKF